MFPVAYVSVPIEMAEGRGAVVAFTDIEDRLRAAQVLRERDAVLAGQLASLRRVATLVTGGAGAAEVFAAIAREVAHVLALPVVEVWRYEPDGTATVIGAWSERPHPFRAGTRWPLDGPGIAALVRRTGRPARIDDFTGVPGAIAESARDAGVRSGAGAPVVVDREVWGAMLALSTDREPLPDTAEARLAGFTELVGTAISNTASRDELARLSDEQAALRRVATLVAQGVDPGELFDAVTEETGRLFGADVAGIVRFEPGDTMSTVAAWTATGDHPPVADRWPLAGDSLAPRILRSRRPARIDDWDTVSGPVGAFVREEVGLRSSVGSPIPVEGRVWGAVMVSRRAEPLPRDTEFRLAGFAELVATAMSNAQARIEVRRLAHEQAALRRVATLVAREAPPAEVFAAVAEEVGHVLGVDTTQMFRYEDDGTTTVVGAWGAPEALIPVGANLALNGNNVCSLVKRTGQPARIEDYEKASGEIGRLARERGIHAAVGAPIVVEGRVWGIIVATWRRAEPLPGGSEAHISEFTALVATAIANMQARSDLAGSRARIVAAADEERRRVVRDLHDGAQQRLVHTIITLKLAQSAFETGDDTSPRLVAEALEQAERATAELRELAHGILPAVLTQGGLRSAVDALASRTSVPITKDVAVGRLPPAVEATAYFVIAEALTNVSKHADATGVEVSARAGDGTLSIEVRDDGVGGALPEGSGLVGIRDRLDALDGRLRIESPARGGTLIAVTIPLHG
jgi:signal transduction histidine kinase